VHFFLIIQLDNNNDLYHTSNKYTNKLTINSNKSNWKAKVKKKKRYKPQFMFRQFLLFGRIQSYTYSKQTYSSLTKSIKPSCASNIWQMSDNLTVYICCLASEKHITNSPWAIIRKFIKYKFGLFQFLTKRQGMQLINYCQIEILHINTEILKFAKEIFTLIHICNGGIYIICHNHISTTISNPIL
jgi:hypothetical protein